MRGSLVYRVLPLLSLLLLVSISVQALELVDPMRPEDRTWKEEQHKVSGTPKPRAPARVELWVQSIQIGPKERSATINGKLLKIGDKISGAQLISIEHNQVRLKRGRELIKLMFLPRTIKR